jgi:branched-chain amino acid transport system substrate-binding protein
MVKKQHVKKIGIVAIDNDFGHSLVSGFQAEAKLLGARVVHTDFNQFGEKQFGPVIQSDISKGADGFYMVQYAAEGQQFITAWNQGGGKKPLLGTEGIDSTLQFIKPVGKAANGMIFTTSFNRDGANAVGKKYLSTFKAKYGHVPDMVGATTYDSFLVLKQALAKGTSADQIRVAIAATRNFDGATGKIIKYTGGRSVVKPVDLEIFRNGQVHHYGYITQLSIITP